MFCTRTYLLGTYSNQISISTDNRVIHISHFFLFLHENICCKYSLEATSQNVANGYPQHNYLLYSSKKNMTFYFVEKATTKKRLAVIILSIGTDRLLQTV